LDKSKLSETDICEKFISPALTAAGWDVHEQILREYPLRPGRMVVRGQKASRDKKSVLRADYVLFWKANIPLAVIEANAEGKARLDNFIDPEKRYPVIATTSKLMSTGVRAATIAAT
jgi:type I restriction enzyme, R subunit